ncbi:MAG: hypothetical protein QOE64_46 [Frankiales bacterium]|jgi:hypothetical protein|nr:hypothetical protein [Frankiales bacterium]
MDGQDDVVSDLAGPTWRMRLRATRVGTWLLKLLVLVVGGVFIALGLVLVVLPGPLTIPPVLFGLWIWSTEFAWAERLRLRAAVRGRVALAAARARPVHAAAATFAGLALLVAGLVAARKYDIVDRVIDALG